MPQHSVARLPYMLNFAAQATIDGTTAPFAVRLLSSVTPLPLSFRLLPSAAVFFARSVCSFSSCYNSLV